MLQIKAVPTITWSKEGHDTVASAEIEIVDSALPSAVLDTVSVSEKFNEKNMDDAEIELRFKTALKEKIEGALAGYKDKVAVEAAHKTNIEDKVQAHLNTNISLEK